MLYIYIHTYINYTVLYTILYCNIYYTVIYYTVLYYTTYFLMISSSIVIYYIENVLILRNNVEHKAAICIQSLCRMHLSRVRTILYSFFYFYYYMYFIIDLFSMNFF